jgi:hypothetical protein
MQVNTDTLQMIDDTIDSLLGATDVGYSNAYFQHDVNYIATTNIVFGLDQDEKMTAKAVVKHVHEYNEKSEGLHQLSVRLVGKKFLFKFSTTYDCTEWDAE